MSDQQINALRIHASDNVAVALTDLRAGQHELGVTLAAPIQKGHKFALCSIRPDQPAIKYGHPIGIATTEICEGQHVHSHNLATQLCSDNRYSYVPSIMSVQDNSAAAKVDTFNGYLRANGEAGTRNEIWVLNTVGCVNATATRVAVNSRAATGLSEVYSFAHPYGCSQLGDDLNHTQKMIAALASHPNTGGVVVIGLGCENNQLDKLLERIDPSQRERIRSFNAQKVQDEELSGLNDVRELSELMSGDKRIELPASKLSIGMKCGGSDSFSGLTANPLVGQMTDRVTAAGGRAILTEVPEMFGAEQLLMNRALTPEIFKQTVSLIENFKNYFTDNKQPVSENPSPGNIAGGITTLEEKSLGAIQKGGSAPITEVIDYGERTSQQGLSLLQGPGNDAVSSTALSAAGANLILFTTGRGTPLGFPVPTIKIASNTALAMNKPKWIDFNAGSLLDGVSMNEVSDLLWQKILAYASGEKTRNEENDYREIALWKTGVTL